jgi:hypothetical protein
MGLNAALRRECTRKWFLEVAMNEGLPDIFAIDSSSELQED